jgi:hypothetical protein
MGIPNQNPGQRSQHPDRVKRLVVTGSLGSSMGAGNRKRPAARVGTERVKQSLAERALVWAARRR